MTGTKELKDTDICILKDQAWGSGALVPPWLDDLLFESLHAMKQQRWTVTLFVWQKKGPSWKLCQLEQVDVPCNSWDQSGCQNSLLLQH